MNKITYFFEKTCRSCILVGVSLLAVFVLVWMFYLLGNIVYA